MGIPPPQVELFSYHVNLDQPVRADHPLRRVAQAVDFTFVRTEVAHCYGGNGNESVDPVILLKLMFLLFFDDAASERELLSVIPERLDYLGFPGCELEDEIPDHRVLSKARRRWGQEVFQRWFIRTVEPRVAAGLVSGDQLPVDASLIAAHASKDSVIKSSPELIAAYAAAYGAAEKKLNDPAERPCFQAVNDVALSTTDPDAGLVRQSRGGQPSYHPHRAVDDAPGVIRAVETTSGSLAENKRLGGLMAQHRHNIGCELRTVVGDPQYGTAENFVTGHQQGGDASGRCQGQARPERGHLWGRALRVSTGERHVSLSGGPDVGAAAVAAADSGLFDRGHPEPPDSTASDGAPARSQRDASTGKPAECPLGLR